MINKLKISITVTEDTEQDLEKLATLLFPHITVSRGDVVDYLVGEKMKDLRLGKPQPNKVSIPIAEESGV